MCQSVPVFASQMVEIREILWVWKRKVIRQSTIWLFVGIPPALGSWWTIALIVPFFPVLLWRLLDEERILRRDLPGYIAYTQKVRYRLIPYVW